MDLTREIPKVHRKVESTRKFVEVLTTAVTNMTSDIADLLTQRNLQRADSDYLDLLLYEVGWPVQIAMTDLQKRKVLKTARDLYTRKGEKGGGPIIELTQDLLGVTITIVEGIDGGWRLGLSLLGIDTVLGSDTYKWWFYIHAPVALSASDEADIALITNAFKPLFAHYKIIKDL